MGRSSASKGRRKRAVPTARRGGPPAGGREAAKPLQPDIADPAAVPTAFRAARSGAPAAPPRDTAPESGRVETQPEVPAANGSGSSAGWAERALQQVLTPTCWLDPGDQGEPFQVTVWFSGRRQGVTGKPGPDDSFKREEVFGAIVPGSGPVAVTAEVRGITPGEWTVTARQVARAASRVVPVAAAAGDPTPDRGTLWPRRVRVPAGPPVPARTALLPFAKIPGVTRLAYPVLVAAGVLAGLALQALLLAAAGLSWAPALVYSLYAVLAGLAGGKIRYVATHKWRSFDGWSVQGFVAGAAALAAAAPAAGLGVPAAAYYSTAAAGLLTGMGIGRPGCFWAGCCVGRPTTARWGVWSSDRRTGCRRVPVQLMEALLALAAGMMAVGAALAAGPAGAGPAAIAAPAAYTLGRQFLLGLRADPPRRSARSGLVMAAVSASALAAGIALLAVGAW